MPFVRFDSLEEKEPVPGFKAIFVHSKNMTLAYWEVEEGAALKELVSLKGAKYQHITNKGSG